MLLQAELKQAALDLAIRSIGANNPRMILESANLFYDFMMQGLPPKERESVPQSPMPEQFIEYKVIINDKEETVRFDNLTEHQLFVLNQLWKLAYPYSNIDIKLINE